MLILNFLKRLASILPASIAINIGRFLGVIGFYVFKKRRQLAFTNLGLALGNTLTSAQQTEIIKKSFIHLGLNLIEFFRLHQFTPANINNSLSFTGFHYVENAIQKKQGILALTAHIGNWELLASSMALRGINTAIVVKTARQSFVDKFLMQQRAATGLKVFSGGHRIKDILRQLHQGGMVGIVLDQSALKRDGIIVPFFGRPAMTLKSLAVLAIRTKATVLPIYSYRQKNNRHHIVIHAPIETNTNDIVALTERYTQSIENAIRVDLSQWTWTHNRWKERK